MRNPDRRLSPNRANVAAKVIDGEAILLDVTRGAYYSMDGTGAVVWSGIEAGLRLAEIAQILAARYDAPEAVIAAEVDRIADQLVEERLVVELARNGKEPAEIPPPSKVREPFRVPELHKYTDMGDLLALDPPMPVVDHSAE